MQSATRMKEYLCLIWITPYCQHDVCEGLRLKSCIIQGNHILFFIWLLIDDCTYMNKHFIWLTWEKWSSSVVCVIVLQWSSVVLLLVTVINVTFGSNDTKSALFCTIHLWNSKLIMNQYFFFINNCHHPWWESGGERGGGLCCEANCPLNDFQDDAQLIGNIN